MLSDESSSDSETGRFKGRSKSEHEQSKSSNLKKDNFRAAGRSRPSENDRFRREYEIKREERERYERHSRERQRYSRHSPVRRRYSRERSGSRRSRERERHRHSGDSRGRPKPQDIRSASTDRKRHSRSRSHKSLEQAQKSLEHAQKSSEQSQKSSEQSQKSSEQSHKSSEQSHKSSERKDLKEEIKHSVDDKVRRNSALREKSADKYNRRSKEKSSSPEYKGKRSVIHKPVSVEPQRKKGETPIVVEEHESDASAEVQLGSYYNMIPAVIKEKSEESSEIDSSDDERLRAKLLNLEKELHRTRKKKHKKKTKRKTSKSSNDREKDSSMVEVSSTTDIDKASVSNTQIETAEVTSTQKINQKESSEEGEITSDDESEDHFEIDPTDLRHKLKRSVPTGDNNDEVKRNACGPALPPHLERKFKRSSSRDLEGPALPPHLKRNLGPSIPEDMRKVLAETDREVIMYENSDEDIGIGPIPPGNEKNWSEAHQRLEERAWDIKIKKLDGHSLRNTDVKSREKWMLELPEGKARYLGLEARSFRAKEGPDMSDRSSWTDTPEEKSRKAAGILQEEDTAATMKEEARARHIASRDDEQEKAVKKHKKKHKREESLLELHQKKLKKKKKKEEKDEGKKERRPFSRDVDLQVNRFDEAQKKSIIKKAQDLNTRFSSGEAKFL